MALLTRIKLDFSAVFSADTSYRGYVTPNWDALDIQWPNGTDASEADIAWASINNSITTGATESHDLRSLASVFGITSTVVEVRALFFRVRSGGGLTIAKGGTNGFDAFGAAWTMYCPIGQQLMIVCPTDGVLVTGAADKMIDIVNASGSTAVYDLLVIGTSA